MFARIRQVPSPALIIAVIALIAAVGGGSFAIASLGGGKVKKIARRQANKQITKRAADLSVAHAASADTASNADHATNADNVALHCPSGMRQTAGLCFEDSVRADASLEDALKTCAGAQRRLPTLAELAVVFENSGAPQPNQWVATQWTSSNPYGLGGGTLGEDSSRNFIYGSGGATPSYKLPYRCVGSPD